MEPTFDLSGYEPPISLWQIVEQYVPPHEHEEIKNMLGESMVDQSLELHNEIETLLDIWRDYRDETNENVKTKLPEPPGLRDRLVQELQFFIVNVKEKSRNIGVNAEEVLQSRHNMDILEYAMDGQRPGTRAGSRPGTARSRDGRETPMISTPTSSDRASAASTLSEEIESMNDKMNFLKFDEVVQHLKETLGDEIETLLNDIQFLYECLDDEATYRAETQGTYSREPTIADLQTERSKMEQELLSTDLVPQPRIPAKKSSPAGLMAPLKKLGGVPISDSLKMNVKLSNSGHSPGRNTAVSPGRNVGVGGRNSPSDVDSVISVKQRPSGKTGPMRASHSIVPCHSDSTSAKSGSEPKGGNLVGVVRVGQRPESGVNPTHRQDSATGDRVTMIGDTAPRPPSGPRPQVRPSSADRFRRMVQECRDPS